MNKQGASVTALDRFLARLGLQRTRKVTSHTVYNFNGMDSRKV